MSELTAREQRDLEIAKLRSRSVPFHEIAARYGITISGAQTAVQNANKINARMATEDLRRTELDKLDHLEREALAVLESVHYVVDRGDVVVWDGLPLHDSAPKLAAIDRLIKAQQRRAALLGLDLPKQLQVSGGVKYEIIGVDPKDLQ